jgi:hypothetical protein
MRCSACPLQPQQHCRRTAARQLAASPHDRLMRGCIGIIYSKQGRPFCRARKTGLRLSLQGLYTHLAVMPTKTGMRT